MNNFQFLLGFFNGIMKVSMLKALSNILSIPFRILQSKRKRRKARKRGRLSIPFRILRVGRIFVAREMGIYFQFLLGFFSP